MRRRNRDRHADDAATCDGWSFVRKDASLSTTKIFEFLSTRSMPRHNLRMPLLAYDLVEEDIPGCAGVYEDVRDARSKFPVQPWEHVLLRSIALGDPV